MLDFPTPDSCKILWQSDLYQQATGLQSTCQMNIKVAVVLVDPYVHMSDANKHNEWAYTHSSHESIAEFILR